MKWDKTIESWGFEWVNDYAERAVKNIGKSQVSIMAFEDNSYEVAWINSENKTKNKIQEKIIIGMKNLKNFLDSMKWLN